MTEWAFDCVPYYIVIINIFPCIFFYIKLVLIWNKTKQTNKQNQKLDNFVWFYFIFLAKIATTLYHTGDWSKNKLMITYTFPSN